MNDNKVKIFEYLDTLVKMSRSKGNGASLIIEEEEIAETIKEHDLEIEEIEQQLLGGFFLDTTIYSTYNYSIM